MTEPIDDAVGGVVMGFARSYRADLMASGATHAPVEIILGTGFLYGLELGAALAIQDITEARRLLAWVEATAGPSAERDGDISRLSEALR